MITKIYSLLFYIKYKLNKLNKPILHQTGFLGIHYFDIFQLHRDRNGNEVRHHKPAAVGYLTP